MIVVVGYIGCRRAELQARRGWELVPIVVAAADVSANTAITIDLLAQRPMPSQFVTANIIGPQNYSLVVGHKVLIDLKKGEPLRWTQLEQPGHGGGEPGAR